MPATELVPANKMAALIGVMSSVVPSPAAPNHFTEIKSSNMRYHRPGVKPPIMVPPLSGVVEEAFQ